MAQCLLPNKALDRGRVVKIPLPHIVIAPDRQAHPYPFQIALQAQEFLQGTLFQAVLADTAAGAYFRQPRAVEMIEKDLQQKGLASTALAQGWEILTKYKDAFEGWVFQSALISMNSHWDWYVRRLAGFLIHTRLHGSNCIALTPKQETDLKRADFLAMEEQLALIAASAGIDLALLPNAGAELAEMTLVRNIGLHNRWEADERYLKRTQRPAMTVGDFRVISIDELRCWHGHLIDVISKSSIECAKRFHNAPAITI